MRQRLQKTFSSTSSPIHEETGVQQVDQSQFPSLYSSSRTGRMSDRHYGFKRNREKLTAPYVHDLYQFFIGRVGKKFCPTLVYASLGSRDGKCRYPLAESTPEGHHIHAGSAPMAVSTIPAGNSVAVIVLKIAERCSPKTCAGSMILQPRSRASRKRLPSP